ncbi:iron complex transport system ATP-binding protein [Franzmannia pantelleriensis]|uniref:Iron complex transport system ATP-binding protein n=1 Tax=Franzmannia pantelleriensis TaxID=48727 RepID=A0A1G9GWJ6_9GAMM|nr:ATP-binding cassette domain-containing protein [Halomonas pantelleriensis]SDL04925.1 iron complex transport system ATP-binding protein [Halomonas pantelleriensis]
MLELCAAGLRSVPTISALDDRIEAGELLAIVGPNGAGKSTLLGLLSGFRPAETGCVRLDKRPLSDWTPLRLAKRRALVAQRLELGFDWPLRELVALGSEAEAGDVHRALDALDLLPLADRGVLSLSGGERQRAMIARALCQLGSLNANGEDGGLLLLDEPTSALDIGQQQRLMRLLRRLAESRRMAICCVLHDLNLAARFAHRVWLLEQGQRIASGTPSEVLHAAQLERVFNAQLELLQSQHLSTPVLALRS